MDIVIVGAGKVGRQIARKLTDESHDVVIIDNDKDALSRVSDEMDAICMEGNGADYRLQREAGVQNADLLIAVTAHDEVNMLCCLIAHKLGARSTIARVRDPENSAQLDFLKEDLGLSLAINPDLAASEDIARLLRIPSALNVEFFARGRVELVELRLNPENPLVDLALIEIYKKFQIKILICAVQRGDDIFIPKGDFVLRAGDKLHVSAAPEEMSRFLRMAYPGKQRRVRTVMILGGSRISYYLARALDKAGVQVKIVESDIKRATFLSEELPHALIIHGESTDHELLTEEGVENVDAFIALTGMDENNIISGLFAKWKGAGVTIAKINNENLIGVLPDSSQLDAIISPKMLTASKILTFVRAMSGRPEGSNVETVHELLGGRIEALEFHARGSHPMYGIPLKDLNRHFHRDLLIACIVRDGKAIIPGGNDCIRPGDRVIIVTKHKMFNDLSEILVSSPA